MYNYMSFWTLCLLCLVFCLLFHAIGFTFAKYRQDKQDKKDRALLEQDKKDATEMVNALKKVVYSTTKKEPTAAPGGGGAVS
jgi:hypothetical protein